MEGLYISNSYQETLEIASQFSQWLATKKPSNLICLFGDLAAGKTAFTQGVANYFGVSRIVSPTFNIMKEYRLVNQAYDKIFHLDLYRLNSPEDLKSLDIIEEINLPQSLCLIEWPEKMLGILPKSRIEIYFKHTGDEQREILIKSL